ncbi:hypothetical protein [Nostoc sp. UHCC 0870]|nr:hypothetical protein [Nostoc sp. UHCC 0870]
MSMEETNTELSLYELTAQETFLILVTTELITLSTQLTPPHSFR